MINLKEFVEFLEDGIEREGYYVKVEKVTKINLVLTGLGVKKMLDDSIGVVVYAEHYYRPDLELKELNDVLRVVLIEIEESFKDQPEYFGEVIDTIRSHDGLLNGVRNCLINKEMNEDLLKGDYVFTESPLEGLVYLYYLPFKEGAVEENTDSVFIQQRHLEMSGVTLEELAAAAEKNVAEDIVMQDITSAVISLSDEAECDVCNDCVSDSMDINEMYVCTNHSRFRGASTIIRQAHVIENAFGCGFYILPSSIHEILVIAEDGVVAQDKGADALYKMVLEVNSTEVAKEDFLADALYYYKGGTFTKVAG